jgi:hypothetical protein
MLSTSRFQKPDMVAFAVSIAQMGMIAFRWMNFKGAIYHGSLVSSLNVYPAGNGFAQILV